MVRDGMERNFAPERPFAFVPAVVEFQHPAIGVLHHQSDVGQSDAGGLQDIGDGGRIIAPVMLAARDALLFDRDRKLTVFQQANRTVVRQSGTQNVKRLGVCHDDQRLADQASLKGSTRYLHIPCSDVLSP